MSAKTNKTAEQYQRGRAKLCEIFRDHMGYDVDDYVDASLADVRIMVDTGTLDMVLERKWTTQRAPDQADGEDTMRVSVPVRLQEGDRVEGNYRGRGAWLPGRVGRANAEDGTYDVDFDGGERETRMDGAMVRAVGGGAAMARGRIYVHFATGKTSAKSLHSTVGALFTDQGFTQADTLVLVLAPDKPGKIVGGGSKAVRAALDEIWLLRGYHVVVHDLEHLQYNALQHQDQPQGLRVLSAAERAAFLEETRIQPNELPKLSRQDVVAALLCARVGDIVYGERSSPTTILSPVWRIVTADPIGPKSSSKSGGSAAAVAAERATGHA